MWSRRRRMRIGKPKYRVRFLLFAVLAVVLFMLVQTFYYVEFTLRPTFIRLAETMSRQIAIDTITQAVSKNVSEEADYRQLVHLTQDSKGRVMAAEPNMNEVNRIKDQTATRLQNTLKELQQKEVSLPLGQAFNSSILATVGPSIPIHIIPVGTAKTDIKWEYNSIGINQTIHIIYLNVQVQMSVIVPFVSKTIDVSSKVPITYWVLAGDVPQFFYDGQGMPYVPNGLSPYPGQPPQIEPPASSSSSQQVNLP